MDSNGRNINKVFNCVTESETQSLGDGILSEQDFSDFTSEIISAPLVDNIDCCMDIINC